VESGKLCLEQTTPAFGHPSLIKAGSYCKNIQVTPSIPLNPRGKLSYVNGLHGEGGVLAEGIQRPGYKYLIRPYFECSLPTDPVGTEASPVEREYFNRICLFSE
jgi:hypothetical protein